MIGAVMLSACSSGGIDVDAPKTNPPPVVESSKIKNTEPSAPLNATAVASSDSAAPIHVAKSPADYWCITNNSYVASADNCPPITGGGPKSTPYPIVPPSEASTGPTSGPGPHPLYRYCWSQNRQLPENDPCPDEITSLPKILISKSDHEKFKVILNDPNGVPDSVFVQPANLRTKGLLACDLLRHTSSKDIWANKYEHLCAAYPPKQKHGESDLGYNIKLRNDTARLCDMAMPGTIAEIATRIRMNNPDYRIYKPLAECLELRVLDEKGARRKNSWAWVIK